MTKHPDHVPGYEGSMQDLAQAVGNMRYDKVVEFLDALAQDLKRQADADWNGGRTFLGDWLLGAYHEVAEARRCMEKAWEVCKPHMPT